MTSLLLPGGITPAYEADEVGLRKTIDGPFMLCFIVQSRATHLKEDSEVEHPFPTVSLLTQEARVHTELQTEQLTLLWCHVLLFGYGHVGGYHLSVCIWRLQLPKFGGDG